MLTYRPTPGRFDELYGTSDEPRASWSALLHAIDRLGDQELRRRSALADRLLIAEGAAHLVHDDPGSAAVTRRFDPMPVVIDAAEWATISHGVVQRARLQEALLSDLYGDRELLRSNAIPRQLVFGGGYQLAPTTAPVTRALVVYSADVARRADGTFVVVREHTDVPLGLGHAVVNRRISARIFADLHRQLRVTPIDDFFVMMRDGLSMLAPSGRDGARVAALTSGPSDPRYVDHSCLALQLGYNLFEAADLTVRDEAVWLRSLTGVEPIDVVLRLTDETRTDPLEIDPTSGPGVGGLLAAVRAGRVAVANSLGTAIGSHPGLHAFAPVLCDRLLGERLLLPSAPVLWCGDREARDHVMVSLDDVVLMELSDGWRPVDVRDLSSNRRDDLRARIGTRPEAFAAFPAVELATTPSLIGGGFERSGVVLRMAAVCSSEGVWYVLPGAEGHAVNVDDAVERALSAEVHGIDSHAPRPTVTKDVWVLEERGARPRGFRVARPIAQVDLRGSLASRVAEALYWTGRNAERAETVGRACQVTLSRADLWPWLFDADNGEALARLLAGVDAVSGRPSAANDQPLAVALARALDGRTGSLTDSLAHLSTTGRSVREWMSTSTWQLLGRLDVQRHAVSDAVAGGDLLAITESLDRILLDLLAFDGLSMESLVRGAGWRFSDLGRRMERALLLLNLLEATVAEPLSGLSEQAVYEVVLATAESLVAYRRTYRSDLRLDALGELLIADDSNPRSLAFQLDRMTEHLSALPGSSLSGPGRRAVDAIENAKRALLDRPWLANFGRFVLDVRGSVLEVHAGITSTWFAPATAHRQGGA